MALLLDLLVAGQTRLNDDTYAKNIYADKFIRTGSSDLYVLLGGGGHKLLSDFSMAHSHPYLPLSGGTMTGALTVKQYIFGYNYNHAGGNAPAFLFDKPGSYYTGIGANGETDTIYFSAATITDGEASWVTSYKQKWKFNGTIYQENNAVIHAGNIGSQSVSYATSAGNADTVDSQHFSYSNDSNSPTYLWATNSNGSSFLAARGSISVNYANSAGTATTLYTNNTAQDASLCYNESPGLHFYRFNGTGNDIGGGDGFILQWSWNPGSVGGQIYLDDNPSKIAAIRGYDSNSKIFTSWSKFIHSTNYTDYVNTTNFPGLNKVGTVTSVTVTGANGLSGTGTITSSGTITLSNAGVRSTTINGNYLRVNTNGTNNDLIIPYAKSAEALVCKSFDTASQITTAHAQWTNNSGCSDVPSMGYAAVLNVGYGNYRWWQIWNSRNNHQLFWRPEKGDASGFADVHTLIDDKNISNYLPVVTDYYWANVKVSSSINTSTTPTFGNITTENISPKASNTYNIGSNGNEYATGDIRVIYARHIDSARSYTGDTNLYIQYLQKGNTLMQLNGGNVGIGTTTPGYKLDVNGTTYLRNDTIIGNKSKFYQRGTRGAVHYEIVGDDADYGVMKIRHTSTEGSGSPGSYTATLTIQDERANTISGSYEPTFYIKRTGATYVPDLVGVNNSVGRVFTITPYGNIFTGNRSIDNTAFTNSITIFANQSNEGSNQTFDTSKSSWGITFKRQWSSNEQNSTSAGIYAVGMSSWRTGLAFRVKNNTTGTNGTHDTTSMWMAPNGNIGIGTTNPSSYKLEVNGDTYSTGYVRAASGFVKGSSSNNYFLLGGGGHTATSNYSLSTHTHTFNLGNTTITTNGGSYSGITGPFNIYTNASSSNAFTICRESLAEGVRHWVDDSQYHIDYTNDETSSSIHLRIINTDIESGNKTNTTDYHYYLDCYGNFHPGSNNTGSIGTAGYKWANMYATTFHGSLDGNASTATSATSATQATNLTPENTAHYFRDPNSSAWRGGMIWGSAGNESMSFVVANSGTRFQFVGGSDIANWNSGTWQSVNPYLTIYSSGIVTPGSATASGGFIKSGYDNNYVLLAGGGHKAVSDFSMSHSHPYLPLSGGTCTGNIYAPAFYESSDERLKDFYNSIDVDLDKLSSLPKKFFKWKSNPNGEFEIGTSAQELQKIYPQLVNTDDKGYLTVAYDKLSIIALRAIDKLYEMNKNLERRIQILESKL